MTKNFGNVNFRVVEIPKCEKNGVWISQISEKFRWKREFPSQIKIHQPTEGVGIYHCQGHMFFIFNTYYLIWKSEI